MVGLGLSLFCSSVFAQKHEPFLADIQNKLDRDIKSAPQENRLRMNQALESNMSNDLVILNSLAKKPLKKNASGWPVCSDMVEISESIFDRSRTFQGLDVGLEYILMAQMVGCPRVGPGSVLEASVERIPRFLDRVADALPSSFLSAKKELASRAFKQEFSQSIIESVLMNGWTLCIQEEQEKLRTSGAVFEGALQKSILVCKKQT